MATLPPPPVNDKPGSFAWLEWYRQLRNYVSTSGSVPWYIINFSGSNITDLASRSHRDLQGIQGGAAGEEYHLTAAQSASLIGGSDSTQHYHLADRDRANHTGTQSAATITGLGTASSQSGLSVTITTAKLTTSGSNGSMTFTNGVLTAQTPAT